MDPHHLEIARCLFRESNDALFIFDPRDHRVVDVNPVALRLTGFEKGAACAMRLRDLFTSGEPEGLDRLIDAYRRTGFYHSREGYRLSRESGEPIPVNVSVSRIHTTPDPLGLVVARDITERVRAQEALRESENRYRGLVESAKVLIWEVSAGGLIRSLNPVFEAITGWPCDAWVGRPLGELVHPEDRALAEGSIARTLRGEPLPACELRVRSPGGGYVVIEVLSAAPQPHGEEAGVSGIARDVTERERAKDALRRVESMRLAKEAAEAADRAKRDFLGNVSHEIRTPLTAVLGFTDLLLDDERTRALPADLLDNLRTIKQNGSHLLDLINDVLDLTKIETGKLRIDRRPCSPASLVEDVAASMRPRAESKGLSLAVELPPPIPSAVETDPVRLRQILMNLLSNAIKFTQSGGVRLRVERDRATGGSPVLRFTVIDTGSGMPEGDLGRLFEPFYTSDAHPVREPGVGLGLAISQRLAGLLGGRITVESRVGEGSAFILTLPAGEAETAAPAPEPKPLPAGAGTRLDPPTLQAGGRVLLAEDNESIRRYVTLRLQQSGAEVAVARNGQEAVEAALAARDAGRPFDWVLMDVQMPVLDGYEATRQLRSRGYRGPIIALTAYALTDYQERCLFFGCDDHVSKPVDWPRLIEVLNAHRGKVRGPEVASAAP